MATQRWPGAWLFTDERLGQQLDRAIDAAAVAGAGILVRHHASSPAQRRLVIDRVRASGAMLAVSRDVELAKLAGALLVHNPEGDPGPLPFSLSVHDEAQAREAARRQPTLVFISPVYPTRSHPDAPALGEREAQRLAQIAGVPAYALGGMDECRAQSLRLVGFSGWAGIDAWIRT